MSERYEQEQAMSAIWQDAPAGISDALRASLERIKGGDSVYSDEEVEERRKQHELEEIQKNMAAAERSMGEPPKWWTAANWKNDPDTKGTIPYGDLKRYMVALAAGTQEPKNVILMGPTDSGKSHAAVAIGRVFAGKGMTVHRIAEPELADHYHTHKYRRAELLAQRKQELVQAGVLIWDDLGKIQLANGRMLTEFGSYVFSIFDARAERRRLNIVTTRYETFEDLAEVIGSDMIRRVRQNENMDKSRSAVFTYTQGRV